MDGTDWLLLDALTRAPRASNAVLARVLDLSEPTIARRYRQLRANGVRVQATIDISRFGIDPWTLRLRVTPGAVADLATALVRRPDTAWVYLASGGTEIVLNALLARGSGADPLLARLPKTSHVTQYTAHLLLDSPIQPGGTLTKLAPHHLTHTQISHLHEATGVHNSHHTDLPRQHQGTRELSRADVALLHALAVDARAGIVDLAAETGEPQSTTRSRLHRLHDSGIVRYVTDIPTTLFDRPVEARLWLDVQPVHAYEAARRLAGHPDVTFVAHTTGPTNIVATVAAKTVNDLATFTTRDLGGIPGINSVETAPIHATLKRLGDTPAGGQLEPRP